MPPFFKDPTFASCNDINMQTFAIRDSPNCNKINYPETFYMPYPSNVNKKTQRFAIFSFTSYSQTLKELDRIYINQFENYLNWTSLAIVMLPVISGANGVRIRLYTSEEYDKKLKDGKLEEIIIEANQVNTQQMHQLVYHNLTSCIPSVNSTKTNKISPVDCTKQNQFESLPPPNICIDINQNVDTTCLINESSTTDSPSICIDIEQYTNTTICQDQSQNYEQFESTARCAPSISIDMYHNANDNTYHNRLQNCDRFESSVACSPKRLMDIVQLTNDITYKENLQNCQQLQSDAACAPSIGFDIDQDANVITRQQSLQNCHQLKRSMAK